MILALSPGAESLGLDLLKLFAYNLAKGGFAHGQVAMLLAKLLVKLVDGRARDGHTRPVLEVIVQPAIRVVDLALHRATRRALSSIELFI